jgi:outer membrane protein TolC
MIKHNYILTAMLLSIGMSASNLTLAQDKKDADVSSIVIEREKTLGKVNAVTADQPKKYDTSYQLARTRESESTVLTSLAAKESAPTKPRNADKTEVPYGWALGSLPPIETQAPSPKRLIKRQAPAFTEDGSSKPQYTPDFSRQKAQLAELAGRLVVDLPRLELTVSGKLPAAPTAQELATLAEQAWSIADVVNIGLANSTVLQSSRAQLQAASDRTGQARADFFPTMSARIAKGHENSTSLGSATDAHIYETKALRLAVPVYNRTINQNHLSAKKQEASARLKQQGALEAVALSLAKATVDVATSRLNLDFSDDLLVQMNQILGYVEVRTQSGVTSQSDLERARTRLLTATQGRLDLQASYKTALYELERLVGQSPSALRLPMLNALPGLPTTKAEIRQLTKELNADLRALRENVAAQEAAVAAISGKVLPTVGISLENDLNSNVSATSPEQHNKRALVVLSWSASMGGKEVYAESEARAELRNRIAQLSEETQKVEQAIEADFALLQSATLRIAAGQSEQIAAARVTESVKEQIKTGRMGSLLDALDASERLYGARSRVVAALGQQMQAQAQLLRWLGGLSELRNTASLTLDINDSLMQNNLAQKNAQK